MGQSCDCFVDVPILGCHCCSQHARRLAPANVQYAAVLKPARSGEDVSMTSLRWCTGGATVVQFRSCHVAVTHQACQLLMVHVAKQSRT